MNIESLREYCLSKTGVTEDFPFDEEVLVFKVMGGLSGGVVILAWQASSLLVLFHALVMELHSHSMR